MPTYDYLCPNGHRFEVIHGVTADPPDACPVCGAAPVRKAFTAPTIHFKGTGWAKKDRSSASRSSTGSSSETAAGGDASTSPASASPTSTDTPSGDKKPTSDGSAASPAANAKAKDTNSTAGGSAAAD